MVLVMILAQQQALAQTNGTISGTVNTSDGTPAAGVTVELAGTGKGTATSDKGEYLLKGLKPGKYVLAVSFTGLERQEKAVEVTAAKTTIVAFTLAESNHRLAEIQVTARKSVNAQAVTVGKSGLAARDMPQSIQVIDSEVIRDQQVNRLADVIKNVNGVAFGENRGSTNEQFFARGYSLGANNVLKNGARSSIGGQPEASTLESVEVLKGSAALLYGGVTGGAVVNMVTKKPKFNFGGEVSMRTGSYNLYKPTADVYGPISKNIAFRVIATKENAGSFRNHVEADRLYVNPSLLFKTGRNSELVIQGDYLKSDYTPDFGIGTVGGKITNIGRDQFVNTLWAYNRTHTATTQANYTRSFGTNWKLNVIGAAQTYQRNYFSAERPAADASGTAARNLTRSKSKEFTYNQQVTLTGKLTTGPITHTLLAGGDADESRTTNYGFRYDNDNTSYAYGNINLLDPSTYNTRTDMPTTWIISETLAPVYRMGAFVQDLVGLTDHLKVLAGLRYTFQKTPRTQTYNRETGATTLQDNVIRKSKFDRAFSPKLGLVFQPRTSSSAYLSYASNFTANSGFDVNNNPLAPSRIDQYEAGVKNDFLNNKLSVNLTWYKIRNENFAQMAQFLADGVTANTNSNVKEFSGSTASEGFEVDVTGKISNQLNFLAGYAYNYYRYTKTLPTGITEGERVIGTTPHSANATVFYTFQSGTVRGLKLGASGFYTGKRNSGYNTLKPGSKARGLPIMVDAFTTFDLSAGYTYRKLSLLGKLSNLTNELNYFVHENYSVNPIPPRMFSTTLGYRF